MAELTTLIQEIWLLVVIVAVVVEAIKRTNRVPSRYVAVGALVVGVVAGIVVPGFGWVQGLLAGAVASGLYAAVKKSILNK